MTTLRPAVALTSLAFGFNLPFSILSITFDYPGILRQPPAQTLHRFAEGGPALVLTWYAFALAAMAFVPVGMLHALTRNRAQAMPALAMAAAIAAALAGITQAMGLLRWVMVVPGLAASGDVAGFALIHAYGGTAIGEHLGQIMTALHVALMAAMQMREAARRLALLGYAVSGTLVMGSLEGVTMAIGADGTLFGHLAVLGYLGLTLWLLGSAWGLRRV